MKPPAGPLMEPLPPAERPRHPLPGPSDWSFELVEEYHRVIREIAARFGLDTYRHFAMRKATEASQIYPVFRDLFKKEGEQAA